LTPLNPQQFLENLYVPTAKGPRRFGDVIATFQRDRFGLLIPSLAAMVQGKTPPATRFWIEATKGASKDSDLCICLLYLLLFSKRTLRIQIGAYDAEQADEIRLIAKQILRIDAPLNRAAAGLIEVRGESILNTKTESRAQILTTDSKGSHGSRPDVVLVNELSHVADREFCETLLDNADKVPGGLVIIATNAGFVPSWQAEWKATAVDSGRWTIHEYKQPAPWISPDDLAESKRRNPPLRYARLWRGEWVADGGGDALASDLLQAACTLAGPTMVRERGWAYVAGVDLGISRDASAVAVVARHVGHLERTAEPSREPLLPFQETMIDLGLREPQITERTEWIPGTGKLKLVRVAVWNPTPGGKVNLSDIETTLLGLHSVYGFSSVACDPWQAALLIERLQRAGVPATATEFTSPNLRSMAQATLDAFQERTLSIWPDDVLLRDLRSLRVKETGNSFRLISNRGDGATAHSDLATAAVLAIHAAKRLDCTMPRYVNQGGELLIG
jgi:phage terminase large subunit-like protein